MNVKNCNTVPILCPPSIAPPCSLHFGDCTECVDNIPPAQPAVQGEGAGPGSSAGHDYCNIENEKYLQLFNLDAEKSCCGQGRFINSIGKVPIHVTDPPLYSGRDTFNPGHCDVLAGVLSNQHLF